MVGAGLRQSHLLLPVFPVALDVTLCQDGPLYKHCQGAPAGQDDGQLQKIPLAAEIAPFLLPHELALGKEPEVLPMAVARTAPTVSPPPPRMNPLGGAYRILGGFSKPWHHVPRAPVASPKPCAWNLPGLIISRGCRIWGYVKVNTVPNRKTI